MPSLFPSLEDEPCVVMLQEMKLLKGRLIGGLITGYRDLAGQQHAFKSWNWKLDWFSNQKMNPGFAGHSAVEVLTRKKGRRWQNRVFKRWNVGGKIHGKHVYMQCTGCMVTVVLWQKYLQSLDSGILCNPIVWIWVGGDLYLRFCFSTSKESRPLEAKAPGKLKWALN